LRLLTKRIDSARVKHSDPELSRLVEQAPAQYTAAHCIAVVRSLNMGALKSSRASTSRPFALDESSIKD